MRGDDGVQEALFTMAKLEDFVPVDHPLRSIRLLVNTALGGLNDLFNQMYPGTGRASIAPEKLMRALLLQVFYSCLLYTSPSPRDRTRSRMPSSA